MQASRKKANQVCRGGRCPVTQHHAAKHPSKSSETCGKQKKNQDEFANIN